MAGREGVSFFDAIDQNKRNSALLILLMSLLFAVVIFAFSWTLGIDPIITSIIGFFVLIFYAIATYFAGDAIILSMSGAKEARKEEYPFLYNVVEGLALASQIPMPRLYIIRDRSPNAFATGRDPEHASVAVTTGLLDRLNRQELEGVVAHEISHIGNYDIRFMMLAVVFVGAIGLLANLGARTFLWTGGSRNRREGGGALAIIGLVFLILAPIFAMLVRLAVSR
ncbi:M48 family metalloprotease, partial [Candidatus Micrarchaeota archaeon]|nr:M48 family metalloprotease [Candidatus Micrarchaeota archaeon]